MDVYWFICLYVWLYLSLIVTGRGGLQPQLDSAMQDVSDMYLLMEETEKQAVRRALVEERGRYCTFINLFQPVVVRMEAELLDYDSIAVSQFEGCKLLRSQT